MIKGIGNKNFICLWLAQIISQFGDRINQMALIGLVAMRHPHSTFDLAKLISFSIIPVFLIGPIAGVYVDRWDRRTTLFVSDFFRGCLVLTIPFVFIYHRSMIPIYAVVFLVFSLSRFYVPAKMSIIPDLVEQKHLLMANSLVSTTGMIAFVLGVLLGGLIVDQLGPRGGFLVNAATFFVSGLFVAAISPHAQFKIKKEELRRVSKEIAGALRQSFLVELKEGFRYCLKDGRIRFIVVLLFVLFAAAGAVYNVIIVFIQKSFGSITRDLGLLAPFLGCGLFIGAILYGRFGLGVSKFKTVFLCLISGGVTLIAFAYFIQRMPVFGLAAALSFLLGFVIGPVFIASNTIVHEVSVDHMRGRVFNSLEIVMHLGFLITMLLSSYLADRMSHHFILMWVGAFFSLVGLIGLSRYNAIFGETQASQP